MKQNTFPFLTLSWPSNIFDSLHRTGSCPVETIRHARLLPVRSSKMLPTVNRRKEKEKSFEETVYINVVCRNNRLLRQETLKQEFFKVVWKSKRAWFFLRIRATVSKQSDCHAGASGWYFERLLGWRVSCLKDTAGSNFFRYR